MSLEDVAGQAAAKHPQTTVAAGGGEEILKGEAERILNSRSGSDGEEFQIKWVGRDEPTWEPAATCQAQTNLIVAWRRATRKETCVKRESQLPSVDQEIGGKAGGGGARVLVPHRLPEGVETLNCL